MIHPPYSWRFPQHDENDMKKTIFRRSINGDQVEDVLEKALGYKMKKYDPPSPSYEAKNIFEEEKKKYTE